MELTTSSAGILLASLIVWLFAGCGPDETPLELPLIEYKLVITDSIGVESGYAIGKPDISISISE